MSTPARDILDKVRQLCGGSDKEIIGWLYGTLNVLDSKAAALLRFNGLFIALLAAFLTLWAETPAFAGLDVAYVFAAGAILLFLLISSLACFSIIQVSWSFLGAMSTFDETAMHRVATISRPRRNT